MVTSVVGAGAVVGGAEVVVVTGKVVVAVLVVFGLFVVVTGGAVEDAFCSIIEMICSGGPENDASVVVLTTSSAFDINNAISKHIKIPNLYDCPFMVA